MIVTMRSRSRIWGGFSQPLTAEAWAHTWRAVGKARPRRAHPQPNTRLPGPTPLPHALAPPLAPTRLPALPRTDPEREIASRALHVLRGIVANNAQYAAGQVPAGIQEAYAFHRGLMTAARGVDFGFSPGGLLCCWRTVGRPSQALSRPNGRARFCCRCLLLLHGLPAACVWSFPSATAMSLMCR